MASKSPFQGLFSRLSVRPAYGAAAVSPSGRASGAASSGVVSVAVAAAVAAGVSGAAGVGAGAAGVACDVGGDAADLAGAGCSASRHADVPSSVAAASRQVIAARNRAQAGIATGLFMEPPGVPTQRKETVQHRGAVASSGAVPETAVMPP